MDSSKHICKQTCVSLTYVYTHIIAKLAYAKQKLKCIMEI